MTKRFEELELYALFGEKVSHALRTPLGVSLGALDDLVAGYSLGPEELKDARDAARNIAKQLDLLRDFSSPTQEVSTVSLNEILRAANIPTPNSAVDYKVRAMADLFPRALLALWTYLVALNSGNSEAPELLIRTEDGRVLLEFSLRAVKIPEHSDLVSLVKGDSRLESLGALFAACVCAQMDAALSLNKAAGGKLLFALVLKSA